MLDFPSAFGTTFSPPLDPNVPQGDTSPQGDPGLYVASVRSLYSLYCQGSANAQGGLWWPPLQINTIPRLDQGHWAGLPGGGLAGCESNPRDPGEGTGWSIQSVHCMVGCRRRHHSGVKFRNFDPFGADADRLASHCISLRQGASGRWWRLPSLQVPLPGLPRRCNRRQS